MRLSGHAPIRPDRLLPASMELGSVTYDTDRNGGRVLSQLKLRPDSDSGQIESTDDANCNGLVGTSEEMRITTSSWFRIATD